MTSPELAHPAPSSTTHPGAAVLAGAWAGAGGAVETNVLMRPPPCSPRPLTPTPPFHTINNSLGGQPEHTHTHTTRITLSMDICSLQEKHTEPGP